MSEQLKSELEAMNIVIENYAEDILNSPDFTTLTEPENIELIRLKVGDLGFSRYSTTDRNLRQGRRARS